MNILIIATGGTIGSAFDGISIDVRVDEKCAVASLYASEHDDVTFDTIRPLNILSERLSADDLNTLAKTLCNADFSRYDGVILTVGSDNLAYLASFVGLLHGNREIPICLVAANLVPSNPASNGYANFDCAVKLIRQGMKGAFVPYRNADKVMYVHSATDIRQADLSEDFYSFHGAYAVYDGGLHEQRPLVKQTVPGIFDSEHLPLVRDNVLMLHPYPLQDYARIRTEGVKAVLHTLYHSATLDSAQAAAFLKTLENVPMFLASFRSGWKRYQTAEEIIGAGAIPLYDISPECAYMKLLLACAQEELTVRRFMEVEG